MKFHEYKPEDFERIGKNIRTQNMVTVSTMDLCDYIMYLEMKIQNLESRLDMEDTYQMEQKERH